MSSPFVLKVDRDHVTSCDSLFMLIFFDSQSTPYVNTTYMGQSQGKKAGTIGSDFIRPTSGPTSHRAQSLFKR